MVWGREMCINEVNSELIIIPTNDWMPIIDEEISWDKWKLDIDTESVEVKNFWSKGCHRSLFLLQSFQEILFCVISLLLIHPHNDKKLGNYLVAI